LISHLLPNICCVGHTLEAGLPAPTRPHTRKVDKQQEIWQCRAEQQQLRASDRIPSLHLCIELKAKRKPCLSPSYSDLPRPIRAEVPNSSRITTMRRQMTAAMHRTVVSQCNTQCTRLTQFRDARSRGSSLENSKDTKTIRQAEIGQGQAKSCVSRSSNEQRRVCCSKIAPPSQTSITTEARRLRVGTPSIWFAASSFAQCPHHKQDT